MDEDSWIILRSANNYVFKHFDIYDYFKESNKSKTYL